MTWSTCWEWINDTKFSWTQNKKIHIFFQWMNMKKNSEKYFQIAHIHWETDGTFELIWLQIISFSFFLLLYCGVSFIYIFRLWHWQKISKASFEVSETFRFTLNQFLFLYNNSPKEIWSTSSTRNKKAK